MIFEVIVIFSALIAAFAATTNATTTADADGSCQLMTATCDENGFVITFDTSCRDNDYKAVNWSELYASGPTLNTANHVFGTGSGANSECRFSDVNGDGSSIQMSFNFKQCGTTNEGSADTDNLIYYNKVQGQEYYADIILGVAVDFSLTCTADRVATITTEADAVDRPAFKKLTQYSV